MAISSRRYKSDRQHIKAKVCQNAHDRSIVYNLSESNRTQFASLKIFLLISAYFILLKAISNIGNCHQFSTYPKTTTL